MKLKCLCTCVVTLRFCFGLLTLLQRARTYCSSGRKEGNVLFNDALNTFYFDSKKGTPRPPHMLLFPINSKGSFICNIPHTG